MDWIGWTTTRLPFQGTITYPTLGVFHLYISPVAQKTRRFQNRGNPTWR